MPAFLKIEDPAFPIRLPTGERRKCDPWDALKAIAEANTPEARRAALSSAFAFPPGFSLSPYQCVVLVTAMLAYCKRADDAYTSAETNAELLMMYSGAVTLADLREMDDLEKLALLAHGHRIKARQRLDFMQDVASIFDKDSTLRSELVEVAFSNNPKQRDKFLEVLSRT